MKTIALWSALFANCGTVCIARPSPELSNSESTRSFPTMMVLNLAARWGSIDPGDLVFGKGYGLADVGTREKITTATVFNVASLSKQFTAFAIALLAKEGPHLAGF
jgi:hypothetical protein